MSTLPLSAFEPAPGHRERAERDGIPELVRRICAGQLPLGVLRHWKSSVLTGRVRLDDGGSVIVKLWTLRGLCPSIRRWTGRNPAVREWHALNMLYRCGLSVPRPLTFVSMGLSAGPYTEAIAMEDLGACTQLQPYLMDLLAGGSQAALERLEGALIAATEGLVQAGFLDTDHSVNNIVLSPAGRFVRLDFEWTRHVRCPHAHPLLYGATLGSMVGSYAVAALIAPMPHPDTARVAQFAARLAERLRPPGIVLRVADAYARLWIARKRKGFQWPAGARIWY